MLGAKKKKFLLITHEHLFLDEFQLRIFACRLTLQQAGMEVEEVSADHVKKRAEKLARNGFTAFIPGHDEDVAAFARVLRERRGWCKGKFSLVAAVTDRDRLTREFPWMEVVSVYPEDLGRVAAQQLLWRMQHPNDSPRTILVPPRTITSV
jgi:DNA-binding LacI/PurR family transcriptional regulator